jgi:hypothetical protein
MVLKILFSLHISQSNNLCRPVRHGLDPINAKWTRSTGTDPRDPLNTVMTRRIS